MNRVQVAEDDERQRAPVPDAASCVQYARERRAPRERTLARALDHGPIRNGIRERNSQLEHVGASLLQLQRHLDGTIERGVTGGDEADEGGLALVATSPEA